MDIQLKDGANKYLSINGGIGLINSRLSIEGPLAKKKKSSFMIGGRSTYSDWMLQKTKNPMFMNSVAHFYDLNGTANIEFSPKNHLKLTGYLSSDVFNLNTSTLYAYANSLGSLNWKLNLSNKIISQLTLAYSQYSLKVDQKDPVLPPDDYTLKSGIQYGSLNTTSSLSQRSSTSAPDFRQSVTGSIRAKSFYASHYQCYKTEMQKEQSAELHFSLMTTLTCRKSCP